jgi:endonuclease/exonuclease/phosphatase family metal-dependent hydrolase
MGAAKHLLLAGAMAVLLAWTAAPCAAARTNLVIASWNVENLFDADDDPANPGDDEYTPAGWTRWTEPRYRLKLTNLASVIAQMRPDILCLAEVENRRVLEELGALLRERHAWPLPAIVHRDGGDQRGIDTAMMARWAPVATNWMRPIDIQRDVIVADFEVEGRRLTVMANHWKSHYGSKAVAYAARALEARAVRAELDRRLLLDPAAAIVVAGDFNDDVDAAVPQGCAGFVLEEAAVLADGLLLYNAAAPLQPEKRATYYYAQARRWNSFDAISVTRGLLPKGNPPSPWSLKKDSYAVFATAAMRLENDAPLPFRRVTTRFGRLVYSGYSDHFPVRLTLETRP